MPDLVRFGPFELDLETAELQAAGRTVRLPEQQFQILQMLLLREGGVVSREEIRKKLWPNDTVVEFDRSINAAIMKLRISLGDTADKPGFIETLARRGYRLMVAAERVMSAPSGSPVRTSSGSSLIGRKVSHYRVLGILGGGGMGLVYKGEDLKLNRPVAMKFLPEELSADPVTLQRFEREARTASLLNHPNICTIFEVEEFEGQPFIVMELLEGESLREVIARSVTSSVEGQGGLPLGRLLDVASQIAEGLSAAHQKGIIHRDIKPANIFVSPAGRVKILDFGLAKLADLAPGTPGISGPFESPVRIHGESPTDLNLSQTGVTLGTAGYMSPEQVRGEKLDARTDLFSFGLILYEMATGQRAVTGETAEEVQNAILNQTLPPVRALNPELPAALERIISKALEKDREKRYASASEMASAIESLTNPSGITEARKVDGRKGGHTKWVIASTVILTVLVGAIRLRYLRVDRASPAPALLDIRVLTESGKVKQVAATPDGRYVAYVDTGKFELRLLEVATQRDVQLLPGSLLEIMDLHFSPDGNFIYFVRPLDLSDSSPLGVFRIAALGGPATTLASDARMGSVTISPDGKQIAYISETPTEFQIVAIDPDGTNRRVIARRPRARGFWFIEWSPLPDALAAVVDGDNGPGLVRIDVPSGAIQELSVSGWAYLGQPAWSPDGTTIFAPALPTDESIFQIWAFDARAGTHRHVTSGAKGYGMYTLSSTGSGNLVGTTRNAETTLWATDAFSHLRRIPSLDGEGFVDVIWVDGRIVTGNMTEMHVHDLDGANPTRLKSYSTTDSRSLARCGAGRVAYEAVDDTHGHHIARTDIFNGATTRLTDGPSDHVPTCTADGSAVVFIHCADHDLHCALTQKSLDSGQSFSLYEIRNDELIGGPPLLSPDGSKVLFDKDRPPDPYEWLAWVPLTGGSLQRLRMPVTASDVMQYRWAPDGKSILYSQSENGVGNIWSAPLDGKAPRKLTTFESDAIFAFDVSPDNRLALSRGSFFSDIVLIKNAK